MLAKERLNAIIESLNKKRAVEIAVLSAMLGVSEMTIRRELDKLEKAGLLTRTFGGTVANSTAPFLQLSYGLKESFNFNQKKAIGQTAAKLISDGETIGLGAGTTCYQVARHIRNTHPDTVVTNAINIAMELKKYPDLTVLVTGGLLNDSSYALFGPFAEIVFGNIFISKLFLGANGISIEKGVTIQDLMEAALYKAMMKAARETILVVDHAKIGVVALAPLAELSQISKLITDNETHEEDLKKYERCGIEVIVAEPIEDKTGKLV